MANKTGPGRAIFPLRGSGTGDDRGAHVARGEKGAVKGIRVVERLRRVRLPAEREVGFEQRPVGRVGALPDDEACAFVRRFAAQVGHAVSVTMTCTLCSLWSRCETMGTIGLILPPLTVEGHVKIEMKALRVKSPEPPMPFIICRPMTCVLLTLP